MKRKTIVQIVGILLVGFMCIQFISCKPKEERTKLRFWHTYTGQRAVAFQHLVAEYNRTEGKQRGIEVIAYYKGTIEQLSNTLNHEDKSKLPNIIEVTDESAYLAYLNNRLVHAEAYLSEEELVGYVSGFLDKGRFTADGGTYIFPIQSTMDVLYLNGSIFNEFKAAYPDVQLEDLHTWKGLYAVAQQYYQWSGGRSFIAIDDFPGYLMTVADQYAIPIVQKGNKGVQIVFDQGVLRHIWDFVYSGTIRGYISTSESSANYQMELGRVVCYLDSSASAKWVPASYKNKEGVEKPLSLIVTQYPNNNLNRVVVPGDVSGVAVVNQSEELNDEAYHFLNWIARNQNIYKMTAENVSLPVHRDVLQNTNVYEDLLEYVSSKNASLFVTYTETYAKATTLNWYSTPVFYGSRQFVEEISRSLLQATREGKIFVNSLMAEGASYEEAIRTAEADIYFEAWMEELEMIRNKY